MKQLLLTSYKVKSSCSICTAMKIFYAAGCKTSDLHHCSYSFAILHDQLSCLVELFSCYHFAKLCYLFENYQIVVILVCFWSRNSEKNTDCKTIEKSFGLAIFSGRNWPECKISIKTCWLLKILFFISEYRFV